MLFTLTYFFLIHTLSCSATKQKVLVQAFTSCMHGYDHKHNIHTSDVTCTRKSMDGIDSSVSKLFEFANLSGFLLFFFLPCAWMILSCITSCEATNCENCQLSTGDINLSQLRTTSHPPTQTIMIQENKNNHYHSIFNIQHSSPKSLQP